MLIDFMAAPRLRQHRDVDLASAIALVAGSLAERDIDLTRTRMVCDWVQYRHNFRCALDARPICLADDTLRTVVDLEIAVDLRRHAEHDPASALDVYLGTAPDLRTYLEDWTAGANSLIWRFNGLYWRDLPVWEDITGKRYEQALPGGQSDARNAAAARELIASLFQTWDALSEQHALPEELFVVELGVGNGDQAKTWLDEFVNLDAELGRDYYGRLRYLMCDYSEHVLELARANVAGHAGRVSSLTLDATTPLTALGFLRYKAFLVYISNVYDNLPCSELARISDRIYEVQVRAYLGDDTAQALCNDFALSRDELPRAVDRLLKLGPRLLAEAMPKHFDSTPRAAKFWQDVWSAVKLAERYVPLNGLDLLEIAQGITGEALRDSLEDGGDVRMHISNGALSSFAQTLHILHPFGRLQCHDIFVTDVSAYRNGFHGPGKYEGSIVNWVNGCVLRYVGQRAGFDVEFETFGHRPGANIRTLVARPRD